jgi:ribonuclease HII
VAACVSWLGKCPIQNILADSKKMTEKEREKTYQEIQKLTVTGKLMY